MELKFAICLEKAQKGDADGSITIYDRLIVQNCDASLTCLSVTPELVFF